MHFDDTKIDKLPSYTDRATAASGTEEDGTSHLEPWHNSANHNKDDYWIADNTKDLNSTFDNGYCYPETPYELRSDNVLMQKYATAQVHELYAKPEVLKKIHRVAPLIAAKKAAPEEKPIESQTPIAIQAKAHSIRRMARLRPRQKLCCSGNLGYPPFLRRATCAEL
jgi:hypothetical protein